MLVVTSLAMRIASISSSSCTSRSSSLASLPHCFSCLRRLAPEERPRLWQLVFECEWQLVLECRRRERPRLLLRSHEFPRFPPLAEGRAAAAAAVAEEEEEEDAKLIKRPLAVRVMASRILWNEPRCVA